MRLLRGSSNISYPDAPSPASVRNWYNAFLGWFSFKCVIYVSSISTALAVVVLLVVFAPKVPQLPSLRIAFVGNSIMYTYDLPRFIETLADGSVYQNSCLHGSLNLESLLERGNGMYEKFDTKAAVLPNGLVDYGACSVPQLLFGYDEHLDEEGYYPDDGKNPCFEVDGYLDFLEEYYSYEGHTPEWDMIVLNDRTVFPGLVEKRKYILQILENSYVDMFLKTGARPVLLATFGYNHSYTKWEDQLGDIPAFTSHVYYGYQQYAALLSSKLPESQQPLIAPVGLAYLVVWEEDRGMWRRLFYYDKLHPSPHGNYLLGCVLFATLYGRMPNPSIALPNNGDMSQLWTKHGRKMQVTRFGDGMAFPTRAEAAYLYRIAQRVTMGGYIPQTLLSVEQIIELEEPYTDNEAKDDDYYKYNSNNG